MNSHSPPPNYGRNKEEEPRKGSSRLKGFQSKHHAVTFIGLSRFSVMSGKTNIAHL